MLERPAPAVISSAVFGVASISEGALLSTPRPLPAVVVGAALRAAEAATPRPFPAF